MRVRSNKKSNVDGKNVSLVICIKDDWDKLNTNLAKLLSQKGLNEIILVDDHSNSSNSVKYVSNSVDPNIKILQNKGKGKKEALHTAIQAANDNWILVTDSDCVPHSENWPLIMSSFEPQYEIILGFAPFFQTNTTLNKLIRYESVLNTLSSFGAIEIGLAYNGIGRNMLYHKSVFDSNLLKKEIPYGDDDLLINAQARHHKVTYTIDQDSFVYSTGKESYKAYFLQKWRHYATSMHYNLISKIYLGAYFSSLFMLYFSLIYLCLHGQMIFAFLTFILFNFVKIIVLRNKLKYFNEYNLCYSSLYLEPLYILHLVLQIPLLAFPKKSW